MPITPKNSRIGFILIFLFVAILFLSLYFRSEDVRAPIVSDVSTTDQSGGNTIPEGQMMEDGVFDDTESTVATSTDDVVTKGEYKTYRESHLAKANEGATVVLFFNASWCPTCQAAEKEFLSLPIPDGLLILSVDYDSSVELRQKYLVTYQHTFVQVDGDGNLIKKWSGGGLQNVINMTDNS